MVGNMDLSLELYDVSRVQRPQARVAQRLALGACDRVEEVFKVVVVAQLGLGDQVVELNDGAYRECKTSERKAIDVKVK